MKSKIIYLITLLIITLFLTSSCAEDGPTNVDPEKNAADIQDYISKLAYNPEEMLNYQDTGGEESKKDIVTDSSETTSDGNYTTVCKNTTYNLKKNFDQVAILRPTNGIVWAGALVKGNQSLMDGVPEPIGIERAPITISINLPGIGANGIRTISNPAASNVQAAIDSSLGWWNNNAYIDGYVNAANSSFHLSTSYSSKQLALDVDLNAEWSSGNVSSQFNYYSDESKKVVMAVFKQAFYDVIFDTPASPEKVFGEQASLDRVKNIVNNDAAPAYIKSVTYGRIIMFRMEAISAYTSADVEAAFKYAAGYSVDGSLTTTYNEILQQSTIDLVTIGGNAAVATEPISSANSSSASSILDKVRGIISGENAVYSKSNPGVPIAYSVFYLKDNSLAKLGYTTEYTAKECVTTQKYNTIDIFLNKFTPIKDCDGIEGDGEFNFDVYIQNRGGGNLHHYAKTLVSGEYANSINATYQIKMEKALGQKFTIKFVCTETDKSIFGVVYSDDRMNGRYGATTYEFNSSGGWGVAGTGAVLPSTSSQSITLGSDNCQVKLDYSISIY
ncbi:MAG: thiol-activated cytolysin family protein [Ignavibacteriales bacterium]|nr:thiol-activated cytolysin family protein [Ignavibacteriales bacterium]